MTVSHPQTGAHKPRTTVTGELFHRLARYTQMVFFGKWALGAVSLVIILLIIAIPLVEQTRDGKRISFISSQTVASGEQPVMINPRLEGVTQKNEPYTVTAGRAVQESEEVVLLYAVQADLFKADNSWLNLKAKEGRYDSTNNLLALWGDVTLYQDNGYSFDTQRVDIDTRNASAGGDGQISGQGTLGNLTATGYSIEENGARMRFGTPGQRVLVKILKAGK